MSYFNNDGAKTPMRSKKSKKSNKSKKTAGKVKPGKGHRKPVQTFSTYIHKVLKQVHPDKGISKKGMAVMNSFIKDIYDRILLESSKVAVSNKESTISSRTIQSAVKLVLSDHELAKHAIAEGTKAVTKFTSNSAADGKKQGKKPTSGSKKAGLQFPVGRIRRHMRASRFRIGAGAPVYVAAVLEYLTAELLELAGKACHDDHKKKIINSRHIQLAGKGDEGLAKLLSDVTIAKGGVIPNIHGVLLPKKTGKKSADDGGFYY